MTLLVIWKGVPIYEETATPSILIEIIKFMAGDKERDTITINALLNSKI